MTNKTIPLAIVFGLIFTLAGSRAFAGQEAYNQLLEAAQTGSFEDDISIERGAADNALSGTKAGNLFSEKTNGDDSTGLKALAGQTKAANTPAITADTKQAAPVAAPAVAAAAAAPPPPAPTPVKDFIVAHKTDIVVAGLGAYLGFALLGPAGILLGAIFMLGFTMLANA